MSEYELDKESKRVVDIFLNNYIFPEILDKDNLLGILVYGSSTTGYADKNSDIDLLVLINYDDHSTRGVKYIDGRKIEYFIKPIEKFLSEGVEFANRNCPSHVALNQNCCILYGKKDFVRNILNADNQFYNENHKKAQADYDLKLVQIENRLASLKNIYERNGKEFEMVYYNVLEMIRSLHSARAGEAEVPFAKAYRVYTNLAYYDRFVGKDVANPKPDKEFVELYSKCIEDTHDRETMMKNICKVFNYEKQFSKINPKDFQIKL